MLRWLKRFLLPAVHPFSPPEATRLVPAAVEMNECQLLARPLTACPRWPELSNSLSYPSEVLVSREGKDRAMGTELPSVIKVFPKSGGIEVGGTDHKTRD